MAVSSRDWTPAATAPSVYSQSGPRRMPPTWLMAVLAPEPWPVSPAGRGFCLLHEQLGWPKLARMTILIVIAGLMGAAGVALAAASAHAGTEAKLDSAA